MTAQYDATDIRSARTLLFVPGDRPARFAKARAAAPDVILIDLEDGVGAADKDSARSSAAEWLSAGNPAMIRINAAGTPWHDDDLVLIERYRAPVMLAKAETAEQIGRIAALAPDVAVVPLVETACGMAGLHEMCAIDGVARLAFGSIDFANEIGVDPEDREALLFVRSTLVLVSAAAGLAPPIEGVTTEFDQSATVTDDFVYSRRLGLTAKLCIHPNQVAALAGAVAPSERDIGWARDVVAAWAGSGGHDGAVSVAGRMVDAPVVERARRILAEHGRV